MRKITLIFLILFPLVVDAQSIEKIKADPTYLNGEGWGESLTGADNSALADLISKISVVIDGKITDEQSEKSTDGKFDTQTYFKSVVNTYTQSTLNNTERIIISNEPDAHVFRFVKRSEVARIFEARKNKVLDMVRHAFIAEGKGKIDDALRYYYWSYCLLKSIPNSNELKHTDTAGDHLLTTWIPIQMNAIFDEIKISKAQTNGNNLDLQICYKGKPVSSFDYTYFNGADWSNIYSARDGRGIVELRPGTSIDNLQVKCEYEYSGETHIDKELESVMNVVKSSFLRKAYIKVGGSASTSATPATESSDVTSFTSQASSGASANKIQTISDATDYSIVIRKVVEAIKLNNYESVSSLFTQNGFEMFQQLLQYGNARILSSDTCTFLPMGEGVVCRSIPMAFSFKNNNRKFVENVTFTFDKNKKIECVAFALEEKAAKDILDKGFWTEQARMILVSFLENYKTAYALKRLDYIRDIFDDNAVIRIGAITNRISNPAMENSLYKQNKYVKITQYSKDQYLKNLEHCFASNEFINIRFANNDVLKAGKGGEVYGIQIKQDYYSTNYGDTGYLFLMVDINDPKNPIIKVRTWQPERDPDFGIIGLNNF